MKATVLIENATDSALLSEHGLSLFIEYRDKRYLLDAGDSDLFLQNVDALGVDLSTVDTAVLSHGHHDHSGGFEAFFARNKNAPVYLRRGAEQRYIGGSDRHEAGLPAGLCEKYPERFVFTDALTQLDPGVWLIPHTTPGLANIGARAALYRVEGETLVPDDFRHEQSLVFETSQGLILFSSCSHCGIATAVREALKALPGRAVLAVVGGFHLMSPDGPDTLGYSEAEVRALARDLTALGVREIFTGHCTGGPAFALLKDELGDACQALCTGHALAFVE